MYIPNSYKNQNIEEVKEFIKNNRFGILVSQIENRPWATHIPLVLQKDINGKDILLGHISKANPQWKHFPEDKEVLAIFNGPHAYVSSSWYKEEEVPTWNYVAVHVYGMLKIVKGEELLSAMKSLTDKYEAASEHPVRLEELAEKTMRQMNGIVGFKIEITDIQAAQKLSQGRDNEDYSNIVKQLNRSSDPIDHQTAELMRNKRGLEKD